jgi:hypothetical protein
MLRDNIHIHLTNNLESTLDFIENIIFQIPKYYDDMRDEIIYGEKKECINEYNCSSKKKENVNQDISFRNMLAVIPGISTKMAYVYVEKYKNMENFINTLKLESNNDGNKIIEILGEVKYGERKIGEKIGEKIYNFLFDTTNFVSLKKIKKQTKKKVITKIDATKIVPTKKDNISLFQESLFSS